MDLLNASTGAVLDSRTVSSFSGGQYLVWDLSGNVTFRISDLTGSNAVLSGLFFDSPPANAPSGTAFLKTDSTTEGNWLGVYGGEGYNVVDSVGTDQYSWTVTQNGATVVTGTGSSLALTPSSTGTYQVALTVTDSASHTVTASGSVVVDQTPTVSLGGSYSGQPGSAIALTASANNPNAGEPAGFTYSWNFGDGTTDSGTSATDSHAYAAAGNYTVTVTVTDSVGDTASATATVSVARRLAADHRPGRDLLRAGEYAGRLLSQQPQPAPGRRLHLQLELRRRRHRHHRLSHGQPRLRRDRHLHRNRDGHGRIGDKAVSSAPVTISNNSSDPLFKPVVNQSSFSYIGSFALPQSANGTDTAYSTGDWHIGTSTATYSSSRPTPSTAAGWSTNSTTPASAPTNPISHRPRW